MARNQKNFGLQLYVDDDAADWNIRSEIGGAFTGVDGHASPDGTKPVFERKGRRQHPRAVVAQDPTTGRTVKGVIFTPTAYAAIHKGDVIAVTVAGLATTVDYNVTAKVGEKLAGVPAFTTHLADS